MNVLEEEPYKSRRLNLLRYREQYCNGSTAILAKKLQITSGGLGKYLSNTNPRKLEETTIRKFEKRLALTEDYFEHPEESRTHVYYVVITVQSRHVLNVLQWLQRFDEIQEAGGMYGSFDILAKLEVDEPHFLGIVVGEIGTYPGVIRTETHPCIPELHWQRKQRVKMRELGITDINPPAQNYADHYIRKRMQQHFQEIEQLGNGEVQAYDRKESDINRTEMLRTAKKSIMAVRLPDDMTLNDEEYFIAEKKCQSTGVACQRIIIIEDNFSDNFPELSNQYQRFAQINTQLKFIFRNKWVEFKEAIYPIDFLIIDSDFVYVREQYGSRINKTPGFIKKFKEIFKENWRKAITFDELTERHIKNMNSRKAS